MIRDNKDWTIEDIFKERENISFPDYQRKPKLWNQNDKQLLIDSILCEIDIPKLYFHKVDKTSFEVIDGQQRLWAIWEFIDNEYAFKTSNQEFAYLNGKRYKDMPDEIKGTIKIYKMQITFISEVTDDYLRKLFLRLQLGLLLVAGEKLHAATGFMRDFVYNEMANTNFIKSLGISNRRYSKETLCSQICINSFNKMKLNQFARTRYEDLSSFFESYRMLEGSIRKETKARQDLIKAVLDVLYRSYDDKINELKNRSLLLTIYLFAEEKYEEAKDRTIFEKEFKKFVIFSLKLIKALKVEAKLGFNRKNEDLYKFQAYLNNAPGEKYQIENRHNKVKELFEYYKKNNKIKGEE